MENRLKIPPDGQASSGLINVVIDSCFVEAGTIKRSWVRQEKREKLQFENPDESRVKSIGEVVGMVGLSGQLAMMKVNARKFG